MFSSILHIPLINRTIISEEENIATGETSQAITPIHFFDYFHFFGYFHFFNCFQFFDFCGYYNFFDYYNLFGYINFFHYSCIIVGNLITRWHHLH